MLQSLPVIHLNITTSPPFLPLCSVYTKKDTISYQRMTSRYQYTRNSSRQFLFISILLAAILNEEPMNIYRSRHFMSKMQHFALAIIIFVAFVDFLV